MTVKKILTLTCLFYCFATKAQPLYFPPLNGSDWDTISPSRLGWCDDNIDSLYSYLGRTRTAGFMVLKDGKIVLEKYFGTFTQDSMHYWASAGKSITGMMVGVAQHRGLLNINDTVSNILGNGWTIAPQHKERQITLKHLLTMTSGLQDFPTLPCNNDSFNTNCLRFRADAGTRWAYHTGAYKKINEVLTTVTGKNLTEATNELLQNGIGMHGEWRQDGVFYSTTRDMARFGMLALNRGKWATDTIIKDTTYFREMTNTSQPFNEAYGYLWWLNGKASLMVPATQIVLPVEMISTAPDDTYLAFGINDQRIYVSPNTGLVVVRTGEASYNLITLFPDTIIWDHINKMALGCTLTGINNNKSKGDMKLFPNPVSRFINFSGFSDEKNIRYTIINSVGEKIFEKETNNHSIDVSELPAGQYILSVQSDTRQATKQFLKE